MASYYVIKAGKRIYRETKAEICKVAEMVANQVGHAVQVYSDVTGTDYGAGMKSHAIKMTRNPVRKYTGKYPNRIKEIGSITGRRDIMRAVTNNGKRYEIGPHNGMAPKLGSEISAWPNKRAL